MKLDFSYKKGPYLQNIEPVHDFWKENARIKSSLGDFLLRVNEATSQVEMVLGAKAPPPFGDISKDAINYMKQHKLNPNKIGDIWEAYNGIITSKEEASAVLRSPEGNLVA